MSMRYPGGFIASTPVTANYPSGVWTQAQAIPYQAQNVWTRDQYWPYTTLLLQGNGTNGAQNNTFLDSSSNNFTITRNGNTTQGSFTPYEANGYWSVAFDGSQTSPPLSFPSISAYDLGSTSQWTLECWVYFNSLSNEQSIFERWSGTGGPGWLLTKLSTNAYRVHFGSSLSIDTGAIAVAGQWIHLAVSRDGSTGSIFVNGVRQATTSSVVNFSDGTDPLVFGERNSGSQTFPFNGYISNARIVKGSYVYNPASTSVTIPGSPLTAITNTVFLGLQSNRAIDNSSNQASGTLTSNGSVQAFQPFPGATTYSGTVLGGSGYFDGTGDYLTAPASNICDVAAGQAFTFECWFYTTSTAAQTIIKGATNGFLVDFSNSFIGYGKAGIAYIINVSTTILPNQWNHIAVSRNTSNQSRMWLNGVSIGSTGSDNYSFNNVITYIGEDPTPINYMVGYISNLRFVKGTAVYDPSSASNITVPTAPVTAITNTSLLLNFTNAGIFDAAVMNDLETVGNAQVSTSVVKYGTGSMAFDGSGDYLLPRPGTTDLFAFGSGDWTLEFWVYPVSSTGMLIDWRPTSTSGAYITLYLGSGVPYLFVNTADRITGTAIPSSAWTHLAICRSGTSTRMFINGTQAGSTYSDSTVYLNSAGRPLIAANGFDLNGSPVYFNGYIDDLRITKGVARYITSFTPPPARMPGQ